MIRECAAKYIKRECGLKAMVCPMFPFKYFEECRSLSSADNHKRMDAWIVERHNLGGGTGLSLLKGKKAHLICLQYGDIAFSRSNRYRTGFWIGGRKHIASLEMRINGKSAYPLFSKYVRRLPYIYRSFGSVERVDLIPYDRPMIVMFLNISGHENVQIRIRPLHMTMWPSSDSSSNYAFERRDDGMAIISPLAATRIKVDCPAFETGVEDGSAVINIQASDRATIVISDDEIPDKYFDIGGHESFHNWITNNCILDTPSFDFNKSFLWAKHDLLEFYSETECGNGFYAGFPEFSWFFGRDGEWMSMAAAECSLESMAEEHLNMLENNSRKGRIPHEIPIVDFSSSNDNIVQNFTTGFSSIDSSPLWAIAWERLSLWSNRRISRRKLEKVLRFSASCDADGDGLIENRFDQGLIGWPESWAAARNGACVDTNAWWIASLKAFSRLTGDDLRSYDKASRCYRRRFLKSGEFIDSFDGNSPRRIKNAMLAVPGMYLRGRAIRDILISLGLPDSMTPWGLRSMSSFESMYDMGYHTGYVWPLLTGWYAIACYNNGLRNIGFSALSTFPFLSFSSSDPGRIGEVYHPESMQEMGQFAQGWSSSIFIQAVVEGLFGIRAERHNGRITLSASPHKPPEWDSMSLSRVKFRGNYYDIDA